MPAHLHVTVLVAIISPAPVLRHVVGYLIALDVVNAQCISPFNNEGTGVDAGYFLQLLHLGGADQVRAVIMNATGPAFNFNKQESFLSLNDGVACAEVKGVTSPDGECPPFFS